MKVSNTVLPGLATRARNAGPERKFQNFFSQPTKANMESYDAEYLKCSSKLDRKQTCEYKGRNGYHAKVITMNMERGPKTAECPQGLPSSDTYVWQRHECACCNEVLRWNKIYCSCTADVNSDADYADYSDEDYADEY